MSDAAELNCAGVVRVECDLLSITDASQMAVIEAQAHSHPWSEASLADCFGQYYRVHGLRLCTSAQTEVNVCRSMNSLASTQRRSPLIGFAIVQQILDEITLLDICLKPTYQGHGYGKQLLQHVIYCAQQAKAEVMLLEVRESNQAAIALYQQCGFVESGRRKAYYPSETGTKEDAILMDLPLVS